MKQPVVWVLSCEHGGREIPAAYRERFADYGELLASHRGWDPGAADLSRALAEGLGVACLLNPISRLLVDANRSLGHRQLFASYGPSFSAAEQDDIVAHYYQPHRQRVLAAVAEHVEAGHRVVHLGVHSFTPVLDGQERRFDIGWLYDSRRPGERRLADRLRDALATQRRDLRQRRNAPYLGLADGLTTALRKTYGEDRYLGIELEVNQSFPLGPSKAWQRLQGDLVAAVRAVAGLLSRSWPAES